MTSLLHDAYQKFHSWNNCLAVKEISNNNAEGERDESRKADIREKAYEIFTSFTENSFAFPERWLRISFVTSIECMRNKCISSCLVVASVAVVHQASSWRSFWRQQFWAFTVLAVLIKLTFSALNTEHLLCRTCMFAPALSFYSYMFSFTSLNQSALEILSKFSSYSCKPFFFQDFHRSMPAHLAHLFIGFCSTVVFDAIENHIELSFSAFYSINK